MINELQLLAGTDIPFAEAQVSIHQPTLKEISYIGEDKFFYGYQLLKISKDALLNDKDKANLEKFTDFDILMQIIQNKSKEQVLRDNVNNMFYVLAILFPEYKIEVGEKDIILINQENKKFFLNSSNFLTFQKILAEMFTLFNNNSKESFDYKPAGALARKIADKLKKRHQKLAEQKGNSNQKIALYSRYVSILAVGEHKDINSLMKYTPYQLLDEYNRFELKMQYDVYLKAKMAGAKDLSEPEDWMKDLYAPTAQKQQSLVIKPH